MISLETTEVIVSRILTLAFFMCLSGVLQANFERLDKNQIKLSNGTTEYGAIGYERVLFDGLKGQQSIWGSYIFPWEESHEGSTLKVNGYSAGMRHYFSQKKRNEWVIYWWRLF